MKYIVYCTINTLNSKIYIGVHKTEDPDVFDGYIGNSINIFTKNPELNHPKLPFHKAVKKYGYSAFKRVTLKIFDTLQDALDLEAQLVTKDFIQRSDNYNATVGGGLPPRADIPVHQYTLKGVYVNSYNSLQEAADIFNSNGAAIGNALHYKRTSFNYLWSTEKVNNLDITEYHIDNQNKKTYLYTLEGVLFKEFMSQTECAKFLQTKQQNISKHMKSGLPFKNYIICGDYKSAGKRKTRKVAQYDIEGNLIKIFETVRSARLEFPNVGKVLRGQARQCKGYTFKYVE